MALECSPPGSFAHGISQARILEWVAISFSRGSSGPRDRTHISWIGRWILYHWDTREAHPEDTWYVFALIGFCLCCSICFVVVVVVFVSQLHLTLCDPWTVTHQTPTSLGFSRQEYWSKLPFPSPGYLPEPGIKHGSPTLQADSLLSEPPGFKIFFGSNHLFLYRTLVFTEDLLATCGFMLLLNHSRKIIKV